MNASKTIYIVVSVYKICGVYCQKSAAASLIYIIERCKTNRQFFYPAGGRGRGLLKMRMYRVVTGREVSQVKSGKVISCHRKTTAFNSAGAGVYFFPQFSGRRRNYFFTSYFNGDINDDVYIVIVEIPADRVIWHGAGEYSGGEMPEIIVAGYSREDVRQIFKIRGKAAISARREVYKSCGVNRFDGCGAEIYLKEYK